ncbi:MAG TPA: hypothetical protein PKA29_02275 [Candidatus Saccharibacteria bacterium]|nr:hypothetical protein [Candidatus Saccharibacteria bacterium]
MFGHPELDSGSPDKTGERRFVSGSPDKTGERSFQDDTHHQVILNLIQDLPTEQGSGRFRMTSIIRMKGI